MKKLLTLFTLIPFFTFAQKGINISVEGTYGKTALLNKDDTKAGDMLDYVPTAGYSAGGAIGYRIKLGNGYIGLSLGAQYCKIAQKYKGIYLTPLTDSTNITKSYTVSSTMIYIRIPLELNYTLFTNKRIRPSISIGGYWGGNTKYDDEFEQTDDYAHISKIAKSKGLDYKLTVYDPRDNSTEIIEYKYSNLIYNKVEYGFITKLGVECTLNEYTTIAIKGIYTQGITDVENKKDIQNDGKNFWEYKNNKIGWNIKTRRAKTYSNMIGACVSLTVYLHNSNKQ